MSTTPDEVIADLERYVSIYDIALSKEVRSTLYDVEEFSYKCNYPCRYKLFFSKVIRNTKEIHRFMYGKGINPNLVALMLEISYYNLLDYKTNYQRGTVLYSSIGKREDNDNTSILDIAMQHCVKCERIILENKDILFASMNHFEKLVEGNKELYIAKGLDNDKLTLAHVCGRYDENLLICFDEIREFFIDKSTARPSLKLV